MALSKEELLKGGQREPEEVEIPALGGTVRLRLLTYREMRHMSDLERKGQSTDEYAFSRSLVGDDGEPLFDGVGVDAFLTSLTGAAYQQLVRAIMALNGLSKEGREEVEGN